MTKLLNNNKYIKGDIYLADVSFIHNDKNAKPKLRPVVIISDRKEYRNSVLVCICTSSHNNKFRGFIKNGFIIKDKEIFDKKTFVDVYSMYSIPINSLKKKIGVLNEKNTLLLNKRIKSLFEIKRSDD